MEEAEKREVELRSEELQDVMGKIPPWILRWGIIVLFGVVVVLLGGSAFFTYPDVIQAPLTLTGSTPPAGIIAFSSGKLDMLHTVDNQFVKAGDYLAVIHNPARTEDVVYLKGFLDRMGEDGANGFPNSPFEAVSADKQGGRGISGMSGMSKGQEDAEIRTGSGVELPERYLSLGSLQAAYASFYTLLSGYNDYVKQQYFPNKIRLTKERIQQTEEQYKSLLRQQELVREQTSLIDRNHERSASMYEQGGISGKELDESRSRQLQGQLTEENMQTSVNSMRMQLAQLRESLIDMEYQHREKIIDFRSQLRSMVSQLKANIQSWEMSYVLMSPIDGKITFTRYWVSNQNVQAGEEVFTVIPVLESRLIGKAMLPVARSGKVATGQKVNIRLDNFPDSEFGMVKGVVQNISLVPTVTGGMSCYVVEISLPEGLQTNYKKVLPFLPNMQGAADIITENMSLLERFVIPMKQILKTK